MSCKCVHGRPTTSQMQRLQLDAIEEDHLVGHRIPKKFRKKKSHPHDLSDAVLANRAGDKKH